MVTNLINICLVFHYKNYASKIRLLTLQLPKRMIIIDVAACIVI